ncbi:MAG TPA: amino acid adenylation domain-containing protein, partial [Pyrinomonadaceae bacterium]|nr:amino acid adenylation domain-containing protein [Pyrinomonadaceae bacterium]
MTLLSAENEQLLAYLLEEEGIELCQSIPRRQTHTESPLSFSQQRLWFLHELEPGSAAYNLPRAFHLRGALNVTALERSFCEIIRRHEVLRTSFTSVDGKAVQIVHPAQPISIAREDLSELAVDERDERVQQLALAEARVPFDLNCAPLIRLRLLRLATDEHVLLLTMHHIVSDEWSARIFINEIGALYRAFVRDELSPLPELPIQYADYAEWQAGWLKSEQAAEQLTYWKKQLTGELPLLELPTDRKRPPVQTFNGASCSLLLGSQLYKKVNKFSGQENATLFMTLFAVFALLLQRYSGQKDILVGSPIAGRERQELEGLIGFFVNTLVLRVDFSGDASFRELLHQVREVALGAFANQSLPFEFLVRELQPERSLSHTPLFQIVFATRGPQRETPLAAANDLELRPLHFGNENAKFDIFLSIDDTGSDLNANVIYNSDLFDGTTIERMLRHFQALLESAMAHPDRSVSSLSFVTTAEAHQLLTAWNDTNRDYPRDFCIPQLFEQQVKRDPEAIAVVCNEEQLTYAELNERANQLARYLVEQGVDTEYRVGLYIERSIEMVVALLAILKSGAAYVPLDPELPAHRLSFLIEDSGVELILASGAPAERLTDNGLRVLRLDSAREAIACQSGVNLERDIQPENLAYVIYTSASTGKPKGVGVPHRSVLRLVCEANYVQLDERQCILQLAPLAFDASTFEIWGALLLGGRCVLYPEPRATARELRQVIEKHGVLTMWLTASLYNAIIDEMPDCLAHLEQLLIGGEALSVVHVQKGLDQLTKTQIINGYGPTEATTFACCYPIPRAAGPWRGGVPIGKPISNTTAYVLDAQLKLAPIGVAGELYLSGDGLARGYLNHADLTAERFIPNPYGSQAGSRLYRTGDLVRYLPDGNIEFIGRLDTQVKVRGFRIELNEIELALTEHASVSEAIVLALENEQGDKRLVAYLVCDREHEPGIGELRSHLSERLPEYMIPSFFVRLDAMPLTPNGKVDKRALPAPELSRHDLEGVFVAPRSPIEEMLAQIWSDVLGLEQIGVHDSFFELGGHSLLVTQVVTRARAAFKIDLPLRSLFERQTIARLAEAVEQALAEGKGEAEPPLTRVPRTEHLPLSSAQQRLWFLAQLNPESTAYNIPRVFRFVGRLNVTVLEQALSEIQRRQESLRTTFKLIEGQPVQVIQESAQFSLSVTDLTNLDEYERETRARQVATEEAQYRFDLVRGPLWRTSVLRLGEEEFMVFFTMHHIISDGWSLSVLVREVAALYESFLQQQPSPLPELEIQYADFAHWQQKLLQGEFLESQLAYWREQLANSVTLTLPTDRARPTIQTTNGDRELFQLTPELTAALQALSRREEVTLFMTLLAAFKVLLHFYSGQTSISVGTSIAGRRHLETEKLVGFFVNTLVLRTDLEGDPSFEELLVRVREVALGGYAHQEMPFEMLVEELRPERNLSHTPLFQVVFSMQNVPTEVLQLPDVSWYPVESETRTAKFDMTMNLVEQGGRLIGQLEYNTDLFDRTTIITMLEHFQRVLELVSENPGAQLSSLSLLRDDVRHTLLVERNDTRTEYPRHLCIQQLFEAQVERAPNEIAVVFNDEQLTYSELNGRANQLCRHLTNLGVGADVRVGLFLEHSIETVVAVLAVLKAGAAYVPLEPAHPSARLAFIIEDAALPVILTQNEILHRLPQSSAQVVCLDTDWSVIARHADDDPDQTSAPEDLAYVIYTSGSTGEPKGVKIRHRSLVNYIWWAREMYLQNEQLDFPLYSSLAFDLTVTSIFTPLVTGNKVLIYREQDAESSLLALLNDNRSGVVKLTPSHLMLLKQRDLRESSIKRLILGGEALTTELCLQVHESFGGDIEIYNEYGPTEATVGCMIYKYNPELDRRAFVPIGRPAANVSVYVLDSNLRPVAENIPGDLYIAGDGLAEGYLNRDELTAEKFIDNPFQPGTKMYRSGDRAKWLPEGDLEFLGRRDEQVKFHAYRIELGEIRS